ncbi:NACHT domain-containing protein [Streptomyces sp. NPDC013489]|uniref:NACHT domain-containing protein n=1 Tax=Streptomyces sp. NPDC013489 TaxID=3155606 RepID=UPI0033DC0CD3
MDDPLDGGLMGVAGPARAALAASLRAARLRTGASQSALGGVLRLSPRSVAAFEEGARIPPPDALSTYATAVDLDEDDLRELRRIAEAESAEEVKRDTEFEGLYADFVLETQAGGAEGVEPVPSLPVYVSGHDPAVADVEGALAEGGRVLLRGELGTGKTTRLLRLAADTALRLRRRDGASSAAHVPFLFHVRHLSAVRDLPHPADFLRSQVGRADTPEPPAGWSERVLASGRGLLLIDGIDQAAPAQRERVRAWLTELLRAYPATACLLTSRPAAVSGQWLEHLGFQEFQLGPMRIADVRAFIDEWRGPVQSPEPRRVSAGRWNALVRELETNAELRRIMVKPVMCDAVCALFHASGGRLPISRVGLCEVLLASPARWSPDRAGAVPMDGLADLPEEKQLLALQGIALAMLRQGAGHVTYQRAVSGIRTVLGPQYSGEGTAEFILRGLLSRSGVLTAAGGNTVTFVHSVLMSYLAAGLFLDEGRSELLDQAHLDSWRDTVVVAAELAAPQERAELIRAVLSRGDAEPEHRTRLWLVAAEAARACPELDPIIEAEVKERTARVIPPQDEETAVALAQLGPQVIDLLPGPDGIPPDAPSVPLLLRTAEMIGGEVADAYRRRLADASGAHRAAVEQGEERPERTGSLLLPPLVLETWNHVAAHAHQDTAPHMRRPLAEDPSAPRMPVGDAWRGICRGDGPVLPDLWELPDLHTLTIEDNPSLKELRGLAHLLKLRTLVITRCPGLRDLTELRRSGVMFLQLDDPPLGLRLITLAGAPRLRALYLPDVKPGFDPARLGRQLPGVAVLAGVAIRD